MWDDSRFQRWVLTVKLHLIKSKVNSFKIAKLFQFQNSCLSHDFQWLFSLLRTTVKGPFCDHNMLFLWHTSIDGQKCLISKFLIESEVAIVSYVCFTVSYCCIGQLINGNYYVDIINRQFGRLFYQTSEFARNILDTNLMYLKDATDVKISTFWRKMWRGWDCGSRNGPLTF